MLCPALTSLGASQLLAADPGHREVQEEQSQEAGQLRPAREDRHEDLIW